MRITCPNCGAQYEVDDALIPETGRDVQCSNCGRGWFQSKHEDEPEQAPAEAATAAPVDEVRPDPDFDAVEPDDEPPVTENTFGDVEPGEQYAEAETRPEDRFVGPDATEPEPEPDAIPEPEPEEPASAVEEPWAAQEPEAPISQAAPASDEAPLDEFEEEPAPRAHGQVPRDENVMSVLREEAEREIAARRTAEPEGLETQPELGLDEAPERGRTTGVEASQAAAVASGARRDLLPDIDEINSSLRSDSDRAEYSAGEDDGAVVRERRRGFRVGFGIMILVAAAMIILYVASGWIVETVPSLEPSVIAYVDWANGVRDWLDDLLAAGVTQLSQ